jgi:hypothetical protein
VTEDQEHLYLAASAKADLQTATTALRSAVENLKILSEEDRHRALMRGALDLSVDALRGTARALDELLVYFRKAWPTP